MYTDNIGWVWTKIQLPFLIKSVIIKVLPEENGRPKSKAEMRAIGYAGGRALCGRAPRTMSGGEPSSIKRNSLCDAVGLFVRISCRMTRKAVLSCFFDPVKKGGGFSECIRSYIGNGGPKPFLR